MMFCSCLGRVFVCSVPVMSCSSTLEGKDICVLSKCVRMQGLFIVKKSHVTMRKQIAGQWKLKLVNSLQFPTFLGHRLVLFEVILHFRK